MAKHILITEDSTKQVVKTIDLTGSTYKRAMKVLDGVEMNLDCYNFTATLHGFEEHEQVLDYSDVYGIE